ncbi:type VII secretion protein EccE [Mycobacterium sp. THU-M116]
MRVLRSIPAPGPGRMTLALLAVVPAAMAYPWRSERAYWLLGVAAVAMVLLFGWWDGLHVTTILSRRLAIVSRRNLSVPEAAPATKVTALLRVGPPVDESEVLPLALIARYLDCYGIRADAIRITSRSSAARVQQTWIGLTVSAANNLPALRARSSRIPLPETTGVAVRRLADHLREIGWEAVVVGPEDVPRLLPANVRQSWRGLQRGASDYVAVYRVCVDESLPETLEAIRSHPVRETYTALEIAGDRTSRSLAAACAFLTESSPEAAAPVPGLTPQRGNHGPALAALELLSARRLDGHTAEPSGLLTRLDWPTPAAGAHRAAIA